MTDTQRSAVRGALIDLDGTIYVRGRVIPGAPAALEELRNRGITVRFVSNTDSMRGARISERAAGLGLSLPADHIVTPATALHDLLLAAPDSRCYFLASEDLQEDFAQFGQGDRVTHVVVGGRQADLSYERLNEAFMHLRSGAQLIALHRTPFSLGSDGEYLDAGAFAALLEYASGREAICLGKPSPRLFRTALKAMSLPAAAVIVVGDDPSTDLAGAAAIGMRSVLVRTGKAQAAVPSIDHHAVIDSIAELPALLDQM